MKALYKLFSVLPLLILSACESVDSDDIRTSGIYADFTITSTDQSTSKVRARLSVGGIFSNTNLELNNGDQLIISSGSTSGIMREDSELLGGTEYKYTLPFAAESTEYIINFKRSTGVSAPRSVVTMPAPVSFTLPANGTVFQRSDTININWTPVSNNMTSIGIRASTFNCNVDSSEAGGLSGFYSYSSFTDSGMTSVRASSLFSAKALANDSLICDVTFDITRKMKGILDPAYGDGGSISALQTDKVVIRVSP